MSRRSTIDPSVSRSANTDRLADHQRGAEARGAYPDVSRKKLAAECGTSIAAVSRWLGGSRRVPMDKALVIARLIGVSVAELGAELERISKR